MRAKELRELITESDVEQKFLYPLLTDAMPSGMGLSSANIHTKMNIRRYQIDKGNNSKLYFPDFIIVKNSFPIVVIEVKKPNEDVSIGYREARLYAGELNAGYPGGFNPVSLVLATNGKTIIAGPWDQAEPIVELQFEDITPYSDKYSKLEKLLNNKALNALSEELAKKSIPQKYFMPRKLIGGKGKQEETLPKNSFGATISYNMDQLFVPETMENRVKIVKYAYINSPRRERYVHPIDKLMRAVAPPAELGATLVYDLLNPKPVLDKLEDGNKLEHKVLLIVGGAGCGKTTFVDHLREIALPEDMKKKTAWVHFNMNSAPVSQDRIYDWLLKEIITGIRNIYKKIDFDELENLKILYAVDINKFKKGRGKNLKGSFYDLELSNIIKDLENNLAKTAQSYCRYCGGDQGKLLIFVLDNCDKRTRDEQLLMFTVAQWLKTEFKALVILPLREETYDNHRDEPPLDTSLKDLVFRIEPPQFQEVLKKRVELALQEASNPLGKTLHYNLPNSMHVGYQASDQAQYLYTIMESIFSSDKTIGRLILGLSGKNIRTAFEIFLEICNSGYITEDEIFKIKKLQGKYHLKIFIILKILLRQNRVYYKSNNSYIKNIFHLSPESNYKNYFYRVLILIWLKGKASEIGPTKLKGYFPISAMIQDLIFLGLGENEVLTQIEWLAKTKCLVSEDFKIDGFIDSTLIKLAPSGFAHLDLIHKMDYWAAIAEDTNFINQELAKQIADPSRYLTRDTAFMNAIETLDYIIEHFTLLETQAKSFVLNIDWINTLKLKDIRDRLYDRAMQDGYAAWYDFLKKYEEGARLEVELSRETQKGFFVDFGPRVSGLIHKNEYDRIGLKKLKCGDIVNVEIHKIDRLRKWIHLSLLESI